MKRARLIPVHGIGSSKEAEQRATSALLAVLSVVRPLSVELLGALGASRAMKATVDAFTEVTYKLDGKPVRPDGLIVVTYGKSVWSTLVEVKTGTDEHSAEQVNAYWDVARNEGIDHVLTISNEIAPSPDAHPTTGLKVRSNSKVRVSHLSWTRLLSTALTIKQHTGVDDPEQEFLLTELIRYLEHPASGALSFDDMGPNWSEVREAVRNVGATPKDKGIDDICSRWEQLLAYCALMLGASVGRDVAVQLSKAHHDPATRLHDLMADLAHDGVVTGSIRVPDTAGDIAIVADLRARQLVASAEIGAPQDKGHRGRVSWLLKQLAEAPEQTVIEAFPKNARTPYAAPLVRARDERDLLCPDGKEPHKFVVSLRAEMGLNRRSSGKRAGFVESVLGLVNTFYEDVLSSITPWQPSAPKVRTRTAETDETSDEGAAEVIRQAPAPVFVEAPQVTPPEQRSWPSQVPRSSSRSWGTDGPGT